MGEQMVRNRVCLYSVLMILSMQQCMGFGIRKSGPDYRADWNEITSLEELTRVKGSPDKVVSGRRSQLYLYRNRQQKKFFTSYWLVVPLFFHWSKPQLEDAYLVSGTRVLAKFSNRFRQPYGPFCSYTLPLPFVGGGESCLRPESVLHSREDLILDQCTAGKDARIALSAKGLFLSGSEVAFPVPDERLVQVFQAHYKIDDLDDLDREGLNFSGYMGQTKGMNIILFEEHSRYLKKQCPYAGRVVLFGIPITHDTDRTALLAALKKKNGLTGFYEQSTLATFAFMDKKIRLDFTHGGKVSVVRIEHNPQARR
jgi:hypothetical protein